MTAPTPLVLGEGEVLTTAVDLSNVAAPKDWEWRRDIGTEWTEVGYILNLTPSCVVIARRRMVTVLARDVSLALAAIAPPAPFVDRGREAVARLRAAIGEAES